MAYNSITIAQYLIRAGITSKRNVKAFIKSHVVLIDDERCFEKGFELNPDCSKVTVDGKTVLYAKDIYIIMNKPSGFTCTNADGGLNPNVLTLVKSEDRNVYGLSPLHTVGRLDKDTEGLLLLTTNGQFSHKLASPLYNHTKTYYVRLSHPYTKEQMDNCTNAFFLRS